jgi:hypothetical protein
MDATCTRPKICADCGATEGEALGHQWGNWTVSREAGCTTTGTEQRVCSRDSSHVETRSIAAIGHNWGSWTEVSKPTCENQGSERRVCRNDSSHVETRATSALGHNWSAATYTTPATCSRCGKTTGNVKGYIGTLQYSYGDRVRLHGRTETNAYVLDEPVENCMSITVRVKFSNVTGNPYGNWYFFGRDLNGTWQNLGQFSIGKECEQDFCEYPVTLNGMPSFDAIVISPIFDSYDGWSASWSISFIDVQSYVG